MPQRKDRLVVGLVALAASIVAAVSARPFAGGFNDGSRLAVVDSLVDRGTFAIDDSVFAQPPPPSAPDWQQPYTPDLEWLHTHGTYDKVRIGGRFYSDKPPVQSVLMAGVYWILKRSFGLDVRQRTDLFCYTMTLCSSGVAYVIAVVFTYRMGATIGLTCGWSVALCTALGLATVALPYVRQVNGNIALLAVAAMLFERLAAFAQRGQTPGTASLLLIGTLAGFGYALELPTGAMLLTGTLGVLFLRNPGVKAPLLALLAALPWLVLHHGITYAVGGTLKPLGAVPEYFDYPGTGFDAKNLTGHWLHANFFEFVYYAGGLLFGSQGFLFCNLPLILAVPAAPFLWRRVPQFRVEILFAAGLGFGTWLAYAILSNNYSGFCISVRWFVPLLAPGFFLLGLLLREIPRWRLDFLILSAWGMMLAASMWVSGPWWGAVAFYWWIVCAAIGTWLVILLWRYWASLHVGAA